MEAEVEDRVFDGFVIMIDLLEIMKCGLFDDIILLYSLDGVEMGNLQGEDVDTGSLQNELILRFDSSFISVEEGQKLTIRLLLLLLIILLLSVLLILLFLFGFLTFRNLSLRCFHLNSKISHFFLIPVNRDRYVIFSQIIANEAISIDIIDMEGMIDWWSIATDAIGDNSNLFTIGVDGAALDVTYKWLRVLKSTRKAWLFDFVADGENPDIWFLSPTHNIVIHDLNAADLALAFWENQSLLDLASQT